MSYAPHLDAFLSAAREYLGAADQGDEYNTPANDKLVDIYNTTGMWNTAWCAIFVSACAIKAGVGSANEYSEDAVIYVTSGAGWIQEATALYFNGEWIEGPYMNGGVAVTPAPGDLITFGNSEYHGYGHAYHVGLVEKVEDGQVCTIEGNSGNVCARRKYALDCVDINMYVRPDWSRVGDDVSDYVYGATEGNDGGGDEEGHYETVYTPLYSGKNDRHDMTLREVCYMDSHYGLTNSSTGLSVSILNYTTFLADLYEYLGVGYSEEYVGGEGTKTKVDTSEIGTEFGNNAKVAVDFFLEWKYSASGACGIVGSLMAYSGLQTWYVRQLENGNGYLEGIGAWEYDKINELRSRVGGDWNYDLTGQLEFLLDDLELNYKELVAAIKRKQLGSAQAKEVANDVMHKYNKHYIYSDYIDEAKENAKDLYDALKFTTSSSVANGKDIRDIDGRQLSPQFTVDVPSDVPQAGIDGNFTSYSYWYNHWAAGSKQRELADNWAYQGFPYDRGSIALIGGYYCFGMAEDTFGDVGDIVVVFLENGDSFAGILADVKFTGDANYCKWGHYYENGTVNMIEWERICTYEGEVQLGETGASYNIVDGIELGSWAGQNIIKVINYGSYL